MAFIIRGVHPVEAREPCHLIEAEKGSGVLCRKGDFVSDLPRRTSSKTT